MVYLSAFIFPVLILLSLNSEGWICYLPALFGFGLVTIIDVILPQQSTVLTKKTEQNLKDAAIYRIIALSMLPLQLILVIFFIATIDEVRGDWVSLSGRILSMGIACGVMGINVAHELGHKKSKVDQFVAKALLLTSYYLHFFIEHNRGHHKNVGKPDDPASARRNEGLYHFLVRSVFRSYQHAWTIENERLQRDGKQILSWQNQMIRFTFVQVLAIFLLFFFGGWFAGICYSVAAILGFLLLECIDYIEHYGLQRKMIKANIYEGVKYHHSWNSNHSFGRKILFELQLHPDHHGNALKPYQTLVSQDKAPSLPLGYSGMILLALIPPLFFRVMNKRIDSYFEEVSAPQP